MEKENSYRVKCDWKGGRNGFVSAEAGVAPTIAFSAPVEFKGERDRWTPEHLFIAAVASCFVVTFFAMAEASKLNFLSLEVPVDGKLGKVDGWLRFAEVVIRPTLTIVANEDHERANRLLEKAERGCLIAHSLACPMKMEALVRSADEVLAR
jgi:peroxiredoxin-like protein